MEKPLLGFPLPSFSKNFPNFSSFLIRYSMKMKKNKKILKRFEEKASGFKC